MGNLKQGNLKQGSLKQGSLKQGNLKQGSLKRGNWSTHELERLRELYPRSSEEHVARLLCRTAESVRRKAEELFRRPNRRGPWTPAEDEALRYGYGVLEPAALSLVLARSQRAIRERIKQLRSDLRHGPWSQEERMLLKKVYSTRTDHALVACLSRPKGEIQAMAAQLCLSKDKRAVHIPRSGARTSMPRWTSSEVRRLRSLYPHADNLEIARLLRRSVVSVANKASQLCLRKAPALRERIGRRNVALRYRG